MSGNGESSTDLQLVDPRGEPTGQVDTEGLLTQLRLHEIAEAKANFRAALHEAHVATALHDIDAGPASELALRALSVYLADLQPLFVYAMEEEIELRADYWNTYPLGSYQLPPTGGTVSVKRANIGSHQYTIHRVECDQNLEFNGLKSLIGAPTSLPVRCYYEVEIAGRPNQEESVIREIPLPMSVIERADAAIGEFRRDIGLDLDVQRSRPHDFL